MNRSYVVVGEIESGSEVLKQSYSVSDNPNTSYLSAHQKYVHYLEIHNVNSCLLLDISETERDI